MGDLETLGYWENVMPVIAYMLTWTTYGSWVQGDDRGWMKKGKLYTATQALENANRKQMKNKPVTLTKIQRSLATQSILEKAKELEQEIFALSVQSNHVHIVAKKIDLAAGRVVSYYKNVARICLQDKGFKGKLWTSGFDKRYCMSTEELKMKIDYVRKHNAIGF